MSRKYVPGVWVEVHDKMQSNYRYLLEARVGRDFASDFNPCFTPKEMLAHGVFEGKYLNDCRAEFPASWYRGAKLSEEPDPSVNCFGVKSRQSLQVVAEKGMDSRRRPARLVPVVLPLLPGPARSGGGFDPDPQVEGNRAPCGAGSEELSVQGDLACRPRQRQALLQWAWPPFE